MQLHLKINDESFILGRRNNLFTIAWTLKQNVAVAMRRWQTVPQGLLLQAVITAGRKHQERKTVALLRTTGTETPTSQQTLKATTQTILPPPLVHGPYRGMADAFYMFLIRFQKRTIRPNWWKTGCNFVLLIPWPLANYGQREARLIRCFTLVSPILLENRDDLQF